MNSKYFLIALFVFVLYWVAYLYNPFLMQIVIASLLAIASSNVYTKINCLVKNRFITTTILTLLLSLLFFAPIVYVMNSSTVLVNGFDTAHIDKVMNVISSFEVPEYLGFAKEQIESFLSSLNSEDIIKNVAGVLTLWLKKSAGFIKDMILIVIFYFFVNLYSKELLAYAKDILPLENNSLFFSEISNVMSVVSYSILITAIFEGALFAIIVMLYGYNGLLFGILYGFASLIPVVGGVIMWLPFALYEYANGNTINAIVIATYSVVVISIIADTFIKPMIIKYVNARFVKTPTKINELLIFFSIIAGLSTFGFWGMILGPAITTFFISLLKIYQVIIAKEKTRSSNVC